MRINVLIAACLMTAASPAASAVLLEESGIIPTSQNLFGAAIAQTLLGQGSYRIAIEFSRAPDFAYAETSRKFQWGYECVDPGGTPYDCGGNSQDAQEAFAQAGARGLAFNFNNTFYADPPFTPEEIAQGGIRTVFYEEFYYGSRLDAYNFGAPIEYRVTLSAVPEPLTWALMIGGLGMVGASLRARRTTAIDGVA